MRYALVGAGVAIALSVLLDQVFDLPTVLRWLLAGAGAGAAGHLLATFDSRRSTTN